MLGTGLPSHKNFSMVTFSDIQAAQKRIQDNVHFTPMIPAFGESFLSNPVFLKLENMQRTGSFKDRGALNYLLSLKKPKGVIAASAGNHAQAVSYHGKRLGFKVTMVMPQQTPFNKVSSTERWGAQVILKGETFDEAMAEARALAKEQGYVFVHAFDHALTVAGQGTTGLEILKQKPDVDQVLIPVGGGGLASGIAIAIKEKNPRCKVIGVQAQAYPNVCNAFMEKKSQPPKKFHPPTIGDGIAIKNIGEVTLPLLKKYLDEMILVTEEEMANAVLYLLEKSKVLSEGAGAVGFAALMAGKVKPSKRTVVVISGGNIDVNLISRIIEKGLIKSRRLIRLNVVIPDRPGGLQRLAKLFSEARANILQIQHDRASSKVPLYDTGTDLTLETRGKAHIQEILKTLKESGYSVELKS